MKKDFRNLCHLNAEKINKYRYVSMLLKVNAACKWLGKYEIYADMAQGWFWPYMDIYPLLGLDGTCETVLFHAKIRNW